MLDKKQVTVIFAEATIGSPSVTFERPGDERLSLRERKKLQRRRRIQSTALNLIDERSFEDITVESIAERSGVSPSTVYRYFSTKEGIFLWDEYDDAALAEFRGLLADHGPVLALTMAVDSVMSRRFSLDEERVLRQLETIERVEPLKHAMTGRLHALRKTLATLLVESGRHPLEANVFAGAVIAAFQGALEIWVAGGGEDSLEALFDQAIRLLAAGLDSVR